MAIEIDDPNLTAAREEAAIKAAAMLEDIKRQRIINQLHAVDSSWARILEGATEATLIIKKGDQVSQATRRTDLLNSSEAAAVFWAGVFGDEEIHATLTVTGMNGVNRQPKITTVDIMPIQVDLRTLPWPRAITSNISRGFI